MEIGNNSLNTRAIAIKLCVDHYYYHCFLGANLIMIPNHKTTSLQNDEKLKISHQKNVQIIMSILTSHNSIGMNTQLYKAKSDLHCGIALPDICLNYQILHGQVQYREVNSKEY